MTISSNQSSILVDVIMHVAHTYDACDIFIVTALLGWIFSKPCSSKHTCWHVMIILVGITVPSERFRDEPARPMRLLSLHD